MQLTAAILISTATLGVGPTINLNANWLQQRGPGPYILDQAGATYRLQADVTTHGTAFQVTANNITFDLHGHTITYDNSAPITVPNGGFETNDISHWNVSAAPNAKVIPQVMMWGSSMCQLAGITSAQTLTSSAVAIPQANVTYTSSLTCGGTWGTRSLSRSLIP